MLKLFHDLPGFPARDTVEGAGGERVELSPPEGSFPAMVSVQVWDAVWLAPNAALLRSHQSPSEGEPLVIEVVGVADYGNWVGAVLMLD